MILTSVYATIKCDPFVIYSCSFILELMWLLAIIYLFN